MTVTVIGDVGVLDGMIHIGDEAMFEQMVVQLRARGVGDIVGVSAAPADTAARYGIHAVQRIGFTGSEADMRARMATVLDDRLAVDDPARPLVDAVRRSSGVVIAGGGNVASTWPMHIFERATIARLAADAGVPLVVSGQTIGPWIAPEHTALVRDLLGSAAFVGLREDASMALCAELGVPGALLNRTPDDAAFLAAADALDAVPGEPYCLVTVMPHTGGADREAFAGRIATLLDAVAGRDGLDIVFSPHWGSLVEGDSRGDSVMHARIRDRMTSPAGEIPARSARESVALAQSARLVVSTRYHPAVFAAAAGVTVVGLPVDDYTRVKLEGALGTFGQQPTPVHALGSGWRPPTDPADDERSALAAAGRDAAERWWDRVAHAVR